MSILRSCQRSENGPRTRGAFDLTDLVVGVLLAVGIPLLVYIVARGSGAVKTKSDVGQFREEIKVKEDVKPDAELLGLKIKYFQRIHSETGRVFLERARDASGVRRLRERDWARACFRSLVSDIQTVENQLNADEDLRTRFSVELSRLTMLKSEIQADLKTAGAVY